MQIFTQAQKKAHVLSVLFNPSLQELLDFYIQGVGGNLEIWKWRSQNWSNSTYGVELRCLCLLPAHTFIYQFTSKVRF
jgi:hypothetical protein